MKSTRILRICVILLGLLLIGCGSNSEKQKSHTKNMTKELRVLAWVGYEEPEIVDPFESEYGINILTETFTGADKMFAKLSKAPDAYDVVVVDPEYISKLHEAGLLSKLNPNDYNFQNYIDPLKKFELCWIDGELYTVLIRFGVNALVYNTEKLTKDEVMSYKILWDSKLKGKVGIWDWYLPNMGIFSLVAGFSDPYSLNDGQLKLLEEQMRQLRPQVKAFMGSFSDVNAALARGDIWIVPAHGEHTAAVLAEQGYPIDWVIPEEGAIMWIETLGIPPLAKNISGAIKYIQYCQRPEVQAKLTWRRAYRSNIPNIKGIELLSEIQKNALKIHSSSEAVRLVNSLHVRRLPTNKEKLSMEKKWQAIWQHFKAGSN